MYDPRPYQQDAIDAILEWIKKSFEPCMIEAVTGAGKSIIVAKVADFVHRTSGKRVLCLQPSAELTKQNHEKYTSYGLDASIYSSSAGAKSLRHHVVFGTPGTVKGNINGFKDTAAIIVDECHKTTPTIRMIIQKIREFNPNVRVIGLTATPYTMGGGYIYAYDEHGNPVPEDQTLDPFYNTCLYRITGPELIQMGYLTQPHADPDHAASYDTSGISRHTQREYEQAFEGRGRKTAEIIADVVRHAHGRMGVMIFAATKNHAIECMESLPPENSRMVTGETPAGERKKIIDDYKARKFKYLVNIGVLTTGFDAPHVDVIAILRATESASLLLQIIGRGLRIHPEKKDCLVLDYAENIERHQLENDLFTPQIKARKKNKGEPIEVCCPLCNAVNEFSLRPNPDELPIDQDGDFTDLTGNKVMIDDQPMPAHFGRRCFGQSIVAGQSVRCEHRWSSKPCHECEHENDIAARFCESCKEELIDPNERLAVEFHRMKADPLRVSTDYVRAFSMQKHMSKAGNLTIKAHYVTDYAKFDVWYNPDSKVSKYRGLYEDFSKAYFFGKVAPDIETFFEHRDKGTPPRTITYQKQPGKQYWNVFAHNQPVDVEPTNENT